MIHTTDTDRSIQSTDTSDTLTTTTHVVRIPADNYGHDAYTRTFGVRWRIVNAKTGKIAGFAFLRDDDDEGDIEGQTCTGPIFDPPERERLAQRLCVDLPQGEEPREPIIECLNTVARQLLENAVA